MPLHDMLYKRLFSHAAMVASLLEGFASGDWAERLDLSTLEKVPGSFVTPDRRARHADLIWRARTRTGWQPVYLLFEFQSRVDPYMALRVMTYLGLFYEDLLLQKRIGKSERLPLALPVVLYNGARRWRAPRNVGQLVASSSGGPGRRRPRLGYLLLDQQYLARTGALPRDNLAAAFFQLEYAGSLEDVSIALQTVQRCTAAPECLTLRGDLVRWLSRNRPFKERADMMATQDDIQEVDAMYRKILADLLRSTARQGREEGREEGRHALFERQCIHRFGPLSPDVRGRLEGASSAQIDLWAIRLMDASSIDAVFGPPAQGR